MIQYQILQTNITRTVWQTVRRITYEILGVKGLKLQSTCEDHIFACFSSAGQIKIISLQVMIKFLYKKEEPHRISFAPFVWLCCSVGNST